MSKAVDILELLKQTKINEAPYLNRGEFVDILTGNDYISDRSLKREYHYLFSKSYREVMVKFYLMKDKGVLGVVKAIDPNTSELSNNIVFTLKFYDKITIAKPKNINLIQVGYVTTTNWFRGINIASDVYIYLIEQGYTIASGDIQSLGGQGLWKKLAKRSKTKSYKVQVYDDMLKDYLRDKNRNIIEYNSSNIKDSEIWSEGDDYTGSDKILIISI